ncbi:MAG: 2-isopropylmalate synthase [Acidobacteria bacterium]|jgi:2-isopropylmalate synthase|nr:2-isopropylmalate synthase [Acidobacteriota bacterium]
MTDMNAAALNRGKVAVLDATLREGEQAPGVCFAPHVKMAICELLDEIGVDIIEAGHPVVSDEIRRGIGVLARRGFRACIGAHARALRHDVEAGVDSGAGFLGIFLCLSPERLRDRGVTLPAALECAAESIALAKERQPGLIVRFTPEDGVRSPLADVVEAARVAVGAGADIISVADTTGSMVPGGDRSLYDWVSRFRERLAGQGSFPRIAVHCHNDRGLALANALDALRAGASIIDASVLGLGERAGIVDLASLLAVLSQDLPGSGSWRLDKLAELYRLVSHYSGVDVPVHFPVMGRNAFSHCAGVHSQAALRDPRHYQSLDPRPFGLRPELILDHMTGRTALQHALERIGVSGIDGELLSLVLERVKETGQKGRVVTLEELRWIIDYEKRSPPGLPARMTRTA